MNVFQELHMYFVKLNTRNIFHVPKKFLSEEMFEYILFHEPKLLFSIPCYFEKF